MTFSFGYFGYFGWTKDEERCWRTFQQTSFHYGNLAKLMVPIYSITQTTLVCLLLTITTIADLDFDQTSIRFKNNFNRAITNIHLKEMQIVQHGAFVQLWAHAEWNAFDRGSWQRILLVFHISWIVILWKLLVSFVSDSEFYCSN